MGFIRNAPVIASRVLGAERVKVTVGDDAETTSALESWGAQHVTCRVDGIAVDERHRIVTTPAYMLGPWIADVAEGIDELVEAVVSRS